MGIKKTKEASKGKVSKSEKKTKHDISKKEIKNLKNEIEDLKNKNLRSLADFENLKKRKNEEIGSLLKFSGEKIIKDLIPFFDDLDRILSESDKIENKEMLIDGLKITINKLYKILSDHKIEKFSSIDEIFDPEFHDALLTQKSKKNKNTIIEEYETGYKYDNKVIKHAKVVVSKG